MKLAILTARITALLLSVLASAGCMGISLEDLKATHVAPAVAATLTSDAATQAAGMTPTATPPPPIEVAFKSFHGRYVAAMEGDDWLLLQEPDLSPCGWFTLHHLANGKVALVTCHDRYVTAPKSGTERQDWMLGQESKLGDCGQFELYELGNDRVAFKTCAGKFFTAGNDTWDPPWSVGAATEILLDWEIFTVVQQ